MKPPIAIQSWCFRHFRALPDFFEQLRATGVTATEVCGVHADFENHAGYAELLGHYSKAGIAIVSIGVEWMAGDVARDRSRFEFCRAAGIRHMSISFGPETLFEDRLRHVDALAEEYDLRLAIHNHGGCDWLGNATMLKYVFSRTSPRIGVCIDTGWALDAKEDPVKWVELFGPRVHAVHIKDFVFDRARNPSDVVIGTGNLDLGGFVDALKRIGFTGPLVIEYEGDEANPVPALKECVHALARWW